MKIISFLRIGVFPIFVQPASVKTNGCPIVAVILFFSKHLCFGKKDKSEVPELMLSDVMQADSPKAFEQLILSSLQIFRS